LRLRVQCAALAVVVHRNNDGGETEETVLTDCGCGRRSVVGADGV